jgi:O-antigen ligase
MRWLFLLLIAVLAGSDILDKDMSLGFGLSPKNLLLYMIALAMFFRMAVVGGGPRMRMPGLHVAFATWVGYATVSFITCVLIIHYTSYDPKQSGIALKAALYDAALFLFTVFYAIRDEADFKVLTKALVGAIGLSSVLTLTDVIGVTHLGVRVGQSGVEADRVFGMFGHANETGALLVCLLPTMVAAALSSRGPGRLMWYVAVLTSLAVLVLTISRGAYVGFVVGYGIACVLCRKYLPVSRVVSWVMIGASTTVVLCIIVSLAVPNVGSVVVDRLVGQTSSFSLMEVSSGRTNIWSTTIGHMADEPLTFLTGFGWNVYATRFVYVTHNYYLDLWFNLGLVGLLAFVAILYQGVMTARRAADHASPEMRRYMIAFVFGILGMAVSIMFVNLTRPWPYIWLYMGISLSAASTLLMDRQSMEEAQGASAQAVLRVARGSPGGGVVGAAAVRGVR